MTSQYSAYALHAGLARLQARMRMHTPTRTHACTHRPKSSTYCFSMVTMIRERASVLHYTYIAPLVSLSKPNVSYFNSLHGISLLKAVSLRHCDNVLALMP